MRHGQRVVAAFAVPLALPIVLGVLLAPAAAFAVDRPEGAFLAQSTLRPQEGETGDPSPAPDPSDTPSPSASPAAEPQPAVTPAPLTSTPPSPSPIAATTGQPGRTAAKQTPTPSPSAKSTKAQGGTQVAGVSTPSPTPTAGATPAPTLATLPIAADPAAGEPQPAATASVVDLDDVPASSTTPADNGGTLIAALLGSLVGGIVVGSGVLLSRRILPERTATAQLPVIRQD